MEAPEALAERWYRERETADPARAALLDHWIAWATDTAGRPLKPVEARVSVLNWGGVPIIALPGEIFAEAALQIRQKMSGDPGFVIGFAEDNPGYIPPESEYAFGGYEVDEAHRYYGRPASSPDRPGLSPKRLLLFSPGEPKNDRSGMTVLPGHMLAS